MIKLTNILQEITIKGVEKVYDLQPPIQKLKLRPNFYGSILKSAGLGVGKINLIFLFFLSIHTFTLFSPQCVLK